MRCDRKDCGNPGGKKCQRCKCAVYCSKDCQKFCYTSHKTVCKEIATFNIDEIQLDRNEIGLTPPEILTLLKYPLHPHRIPPISDMEPRRQGAKKRFARFQSIDTVPPHIARIYAAYPVERFYVRHSAFGTDSPARIFGVAECCPEADPRSALVWTLGCSLLTDSGREMLKSTSIFENICVPVLASELSAVDEYPIEMRTVVQTYSKTPGIYLDPHGWALALSAYHDKTCSGCGSELCAGCGRREEQTTDQLSALRLH